MLTTIKPSNLHVHLRRGLMLRLVLPFTVRQFRYATVMPNTNPGIYTAEDVITYRQEILEELDRLREQDGVDYKFSPIMVLYITPQTTPEMVEAAYAAGAIAGKLYPKDGTTNSADGIKYYWPLYPVFKKMEELGMRLLIHGEIVRYENQVRSLVFLPILEEIANMFPRLFIVLEHIPNYEGVEAVMRHDNVAGTISLHHLLETETTVMGHKFLTHHNWKPKVQMEHDRERLCWAATSGRADFFNGNDSAPHPRGDKEAAECGAGGFSEPVTMPRLAQLFEERNALHNLEGFASIHGPQWYGLPVDTEEKLTLVKEDWTVPSVYTLEDLEVVPYLRGQTMRWKVA